VRDYTVQRTVSRREGQFILNVGSGKLRLVIGAIADSVLRS
jgi:hypothetical protein